MTGTTADGGTGVADERRVSAFEETLLGQPDAVAAAVTGNLDKIRAASAMVAAARRVRLAGVGASGHAAQIGELLLRAIGVDARATHAYELTTFPTNFDPNELVIVISHRGGKSYSARALQRALQSGLKTLAITGQEATLPQPPDVVIETVPQERSSAHSASFTAALAVLTTIAARCEPRSPLATAAPTLPECLRAMQASRATAAAVAEVVAEPERRTLLLGAGGCHPIARGGALLLKETSYVVAEGNHLEDGLHGGLHGLRPGDVLVQLAPDGVTNDRQADLARVAEGLGFERWKIGGQPDGARWHTPLPDVPDVVAPIPASVPLQWLALETALRRGTNPDSFRRDDERWDRAYATIEL